MLCDQHILADDSQCWRCRIAALEADKDEMLDGLERMDAEIAAWKRHWMAGREENIKLKELLLRYRNETPLGHQPHMIAHEVDALLKETTT